MKDLPHICPMSRKAQVEFVEGAEQRSRDYTRKNMEYIRALNKSLLKENPSMQMPADIDEEIKSLKVTRILLQAKLENRYLDETKVLEYMKLLEEVEALQKKLGDPKPFSLNWILNPPKLT